MAERSSPIVVNANTATVNDYGANTYTLACLVSESLVVTMLQSKRKQQQLMRNSSSKQTYYTTVDLGIEPGTTMQFKIYATDRAGNPGYVTARDLFEGLYKSDVSATSFSGWNFTHPSGFGGKKTAKLVVTERDELGNSYVTTIPITVSEVTHGAENGVMVTTVTVQVEAAITTA